MNNLTKKDISIAVIGKSSAGKSAFIRTFAKNPQLIDSVGKGQTTRAYAEYHFSVDKAENEEQVFVRLMTQSEFVENRIAQVIDKLHKEEEKVDIMWLKEQFADVDYNERMKEIILFADDFFNVKEFSVLNNNAVTKKIEEHYSILETRVLNDDSSIDVETFLKTLFEHAYTLVVDEISKQYEGEGILTFENNIYLFKFDLTDQYKSLLSLFLKVENQNNQKMSFTSIVSKVRIVSGFNEMYLDIFNELKINSLTLIDTFGLDHAESVDNDILQERYHRIFNVDYPDITVAFFVEALHAGASNDFKKSITLLYKTRPDIISYIIATYIDENENLSDYKSWLLSMAKPFDEIPKLNGKVLDILYNQNEFVTVLRRSGISKTMADKRIEIMKKRFAPFCGKKSSIASSSLLQEMNVISIKSVMQSIIDREHLGDSYIDINNIMIKLNDGQILRQMVELMVKIATKKFQEKFLASASRTKGKLREKLENHIMGFNGSTLDVTWVRVFRDAYNEVFTTVINLNNKKGMLSDFWSIEGNSKVGFDELMNQIFPYMFKQACMDKKELSRYTQELNCSACFKDNNFQKCIWHLFIDLSGKPDFSNYKEHSREMLVGEWLIKLHNFEQKSNEDFYENLYNMIKECLETNFLKLCREHNVRVVSKKIITSDIAFVDAKNATYEELLKIDADLKHEEFDVLLKSYLCES